MWIEALATDLGTAKHVVVDDQEHGRIVGAEALAAYAAASRRPRSVEPRLAFSAGDRTVREFRTEVDGAADPVELPVAAVIERAGDAVVCRIYHSLWPMTGGHRVRPPILPLDPELLPSDVVGAYFRAIRRGDPDAAAATLTEDAVFREPSGEAYGHRGHAALLAHYRMLFAKGGVGITFAALTDDGTHVACEYACDALGPARFAPQAGVAIYDRTADGRIAAARVYDDVFLPT